jgi:hypothetical protein
MSALVDVYTSHSSHNPHPVLLWENRELSGALQITAAKSSRMVESHHLASTLFAQAADGGAFVSDDIDAHPLVFRWHCHKNETASTARGINRCRVGQRCPPSAFRDCHSRETSGILETGQIPVMP